MSHPLHDVFADLHTEEIIGTLIAQRRVPLFDEITEEQIQKISMMLWQLEYEDVSEIELLIASPGGDLEAALHLQDAIDSLNSEVNGIVISKADSAAAAILQMCEEKTALPHARFFLHYAKCTRSIQLNFDPENMDDQEKVSYFDNLVGPAQKTIELFTENSALSREEVKKLFQKGDRFNQKLTADEMKDRGLIDRITEDFAFFGSEWQGAAG